MITELFYLHIVKMNKGSSPFLDTCTDELKIALRAWRVSGAFEKWVPGLSTFIVVTSLLKNGMYYK